MNESMLLKPFSGNMIGLSVCMNVSAYLCNIRNVRIVRLKRENIIEIRCLYVMRPSWVRLLL